MTFKALDLPDLNCLYTAIHVQQGLHMTLCVCVCVCVCVCHICISKPHSIRAATSTVILEADTNYWSLRPEAIKPLESGFIYLCAGWEPAAYPVPGIPAGTRNCKFKGFQT